MHSKRCYQICICSVSLEKLESFENTGLQYYFPENVRCNLTFYESENFYSPTQFSSENFKFPFSKKISLTWGEKCEKLKSKEW